MEFLCKCAGDSSPFQNDCFVQTVETADSMYRSSSSSVNDNIKTTLLICFIFVVSLDLWSFGVITGN